MRRVAWLRDDERREATAVCEDAGTLCSCAGSACAEPTEMLRITARLVLDDEVDEETRKT